MSGDDKRPLGKILLQRKLVSQTELDDALRTQRRSSAPEPLASQLVDEGKVDETDALRALSEQYGVPGIDLTQVAIAVEHLDLVPAEVAKNHRVLPVLVRGDRIFLAMGDPHDKRMVDELEFVTGKKVYPYIAVHRTLMNTIAAAYAAKVRGSSHYLGPQVPEETLRQLGIAPRKETSVATNVATPAAADAKRKVAAKPPIAPPPLKPPATAAQGPAPATMSTPLVPDGSLVMGEAVGAASLTSEISTSQFGTMRQEVSSVANLPTDLRSASQAASEAAVGAGKLVLVVDDEEEIRMLLARLLTQKGYRVLEANRGLLALRLVKDHVPDLVILDAMMPELHGFEIARRIKGSEKYAHIPIIMVSAVHRGWRFAEDLKQSCGVEEYIDKPFRVADVVAAVQRLLATGDAQPVDPKRDPDYLSAEAERALSEGIAAYKAGKINDAIEHLKRGVSIDPLAYRLRFHLALLYGKSGQIYEGMQELERAIDLHPRQYPALKNLAVLYEKAGFKNKAVEMWERSLSVAPDDATRTSLKEHLLKLI